LRNCGELNSMATQNTSTRQVFISHATQDGEFAHRLAGDLQRLGITIWIAPDSILPGESWVKAIERGLRESSHVVIVLTPAALESQWVEKETDVAIAQERKGRIKILPLDVKACEVPLLLSSYQMVSFRRDYDAGFGQLANILGLHVTGARQLFEPEMVLIPAGEFLMGSDPEKDKYAEDNEQPQHSLYLPDYYIAKTPVTNAQYAAFVEAGHKPPKHWKGKKPPQGKKDHPVVNVSWHDAMAYCKWLAELTGKAYRLPSEAEWEKAARGTEGRIYPWGNEWDAERCNTKGGGKGGKTRVGPYPQGASPYGLLDMAGNVWEWCHSLGRPYPYDATDGREDAEAGDLRVMRGGAFYLGARYARCAYRGGDSPDYEFSAVGFRLVLAPGIL
jgi:formylglycine-generating enzyme required for sulfatase activity